MEADGGTALGEPVIGASDGLGAGAPGGAPVSAPSASKAGAPGASGSAAPPPIFSSSLLGDGGRGDRTGDPEGALGVVTPEGAGSCEPWPDPQGEVLPTPVAGVGHHAGCRPCSDAHAAKILEAANSGLRPDLSRHGYRLAKRVFDVVASGAAIVVLLVPSLVLCAVICIKSPGSSPLYSQLRVGRLKKDGSYRLFRMWKFRSMVPRAEEMLEGLREANEADGPLFKIKDDPRIIPGVGTFIRRHSIDELAQLLNVLKGDMSLIGPRPALPSEVVQYDERVRRRLTVKPGCGGAWQVGTRSDSTFDGMVDLDLGYIERSSIACDLALVFQTIRTMIRGGGAY